MDDSRLLGDLSAGNPDALAHLVGRHLGLVYWACARQVGEGARAELAAQGVFVLLARQAATALRRVRKQGSVVPWLFEAAYHVCGALRKAPAGERAGAGRAERGGYAPAADWARLAPHLDEALAGLPRGEREAFLLKYVADLPVREVGRALGVSDLGAGRRIAAAVARVRRFMEGRNLSIAPDALVAGVQAHAVRPAPEGAAYRVHVGALTALTPGAAGTAGAKGTAAEAAPAGILADRVAGRLRRARVTAAVLGAACLLLAAATLGVGYRVIRDRAAATQPADGPTGSGLVQGGTAGPAGTSAGTSAGSTGGGTGASGDPGNATKPPAIDLAGIRTPPAAKPPRPVDPALAEEFLVAVRRGDLAAVRELAERDEAVLNAREPGATGRPAVRVAAERVDWRRPEALKVAHFLIEAGAQVDVCTAARAGHLGAVHALLMRSPALLDRSDPVTGLTPLQSAVLFPGSAPECEQVATYLIQVGAKVDLWTACALALKGDVERELGADPKAASARLRGAMPLHWAARPRRYADDPLAIPRLLIERGADVRARDESADGMTSLHHAAEWGDQVAMAGLLLEKGADVNAPDDYGWTPADYAHDRGRSEMEAFLAGKGGKRTTVEHEPVSSKTGRFYAAVKAGDARQVKILIDDTPALAGARGPTGQTPLHEAAAGGHLKVIDLLLAEKVDVNAQETNRYGGTPLQWAVGAGRAEVAKYLVAKAADAKVVNQRTGGTLLHTLARGSDDAATAEWVLSLGIDINANDRAGHTALYYAERGGRGVVAGKLKAAGGRAE